MRAWLYILRCADGSYYTGSTNNLTLRVAQHQAGEGGVIPVIACRLVWSILKSFHRSTTRSYVSDRSRGGRALRRKRSYVAISSPWSNYPSLGLDRIQMMSTLSSLKGEDLRTETTLLLRSHGCVRIWGHRSILSLLKDMTGCLRI